MEENQEVVESVDLDELLGLVDEDLSLSESSEDIPTVNDEYNDTIEDPHVSMRSSSILEVLKVSALISSAGENSFEGKVVVFDINSDRVIAKMSDNKRVVERDIDILNKDSNSFEGFLAFSLSFLSKAIKVCGDTFSIIERSNEDGDRTYSLVIPGGELAMDNIRISKDKYSEDFSSHDYHKYSKNNVKEAISKLSAFAATSFKSGKSIDFVGKEIQTVPVNSIAKISYSESFPKFRLMLIDTKILNTLALGDSDTNLSISDDGKYFKGESFRFKTESYDVTDCAFNSIVSRMFTGESVSVDNKHLGKITELSCSLDTSIGSMKFNYTDEGSIECEILTKRNNSKVVLQGSENRNTVRLESPVEIPSNNLRGALSVFNGDTNISIIVSTDGLALESGNARVAVLGKGVGK